MTDDTGLGRVMLGLEGFAVIGVEFVAGELWLHVETLPAPTGCPDCGVLTSAHDQRASRLRYLPVGLSPHLSVNN